MLRLGVGLFILVVSFHCSANDFSYKGTTNQSMSKFQRIGHIETFLQSIDKKMQSFNTRVEKDRRNELKSFKEKMTLLTNEITEVKRQVEKVRTSEIPAIKKSFEEKKNSELIEKVKKQTADIEELKNEVLSLQTVLKSLVKMKKIDEQVKRKKKLPRKKSP